MKTTAVIPRNARQAARCAKRVASALLVVVVLMALTAPSIALADAVTNAYWTGTGHGYAFGAAGVGVVGDKGMVSAFYTGSRDGYDSRLALAMLTTPRGTLIMIR